MQNIIKDQRIVQDDWRRLSASDDGQLETVAPEVDIIVPLANWLATPETWLSRPGKVGVWLLPDDDPALLAPWLTRLPLIAIEFPVFTDGRGFSTGRLLRERYNYQGEVRAVGDIWSDQLQALWRVGFDAFEVKTGKSLEECLQAMTTFSDSYQAHFRQAEPLFKRHITKT